MSGGRGGGTATWGNAWCKRDQLRNIGSNSIFALHCTWLSSSSSFNFVPQAQIVQCKMFLAAEWQLSALPGCILRDGNLGCPCLDGMLGVQTRLQSIDKIRGPGVPVKCLAKIWACCRSQMHVKQPLVGNFSRSLPTQSIVMVPLGYALVP